MATRKKRPPKLKFATADIGFDNMNRDDDDPLYWDLNLAKRITTLEAEVDELKATFGRLARDGLKKLR